MATISPESTDASARRPLCLTRRPAAVALPAGLVPSRVEAIRLLKNKWVNGTILHYHFLDEPRANWPEPQKAAVRAAFERWKGLGIGLEFVETGDASEAELRIGFDQSDGSWSYVGTDVLKYSERNRTMNYGWDLTDAWGKATALHEIGHAIGMPHEHQSPKAGITWNEPLVYEYFGGPPNSWDRPKIYENILRKIDPGAVEGGNWDPRSIMEYPFEAGLILAPAPYDQGIGENRDLSNDDIAWVRRFYPPLAPAQPIGVMQLRPIDSESGAQSDFVFEPDATRDYTLRTVGASDSKIVVFVDRDGEPRHHAGADDSGLPENASITTKLVKGERYTVRVRTHYSDAPGGLGMLIS